MIREALADRIVHGFWQPGEALDETTLAAEFSVSRTPVREALRQLETIGLAASRPHKGTTVTNLSKTELDDAFLVMAELEALCASLCASALDAAGREALAAMHSEGEAMVARDDLHAFRDHNERFHNAIYRGTGNAFLEELTFGVRRRLGPFRKIQFELLHRIASSQSEHALVVKAILERDSAAAAAAMRDHMLMVRRKVDEVSAPLSLRFRIDMTS
jgi:DNA-binding GntR family transcriptional regulator